MCLCTNPSNRNDSCIKASVKGSGGESASVREPRSGVRRPARVQSVTNTFFLTEYEYRILFGFQKSLNTEYWILFGIEKIRIPNTKYYSVSRKSEYRLQIVLFGLTIRIPNTKYQIVYNILEKTKLKLRFLFHTRHFVLKICEIIWTGIRFNYSNTQILFGVPKNPNTKYRILFSIEKIRIPNTNTTIRSNYSNSIRIPNYSSHPALKGG